jgi:hypothetical protein
MLRFWPNPILPYNGSINCGPNLIKAMGKGIDPLPVAGLAATLSRGPRIELQLLGKKIEGEIIWWLRSFSPFSGAGIVAMPTSRSGRLDRRLN